MEALSGWHTRTSSPRVDIAKADKIVGWMREEELEWLAREAAKHQTIVEIGSYKGRSTRALVDNTQGKVFAIDNWKGDRSERLSEAEQEKLFEIFQVNLEDAISSGKLVYLRTDHKNVPDDFAMFPDMVFIDGVHTYDAVRYDINHWLNRLKQGGLISGHDYDCKDVEKAVIDSIGTPNVASGTTIWFKNF